MFSPEVQAQFAVAEKLVTTFSALIIPLLIMHCSCVSLNCKIRLENLFAQFTLNKLKNVFVQEFDMVLENVKCFESQVTILAAEFSLTIMHLDVTLKSLVANESLRTLLTIV